MARLKRLLESPRLDGAVTRVRGLVDRLVDAYDAADDDWWPVDGDYHQANATDPRFEVVVGAVLTQNTTWRNVETALGRLKRRKLLSPSAVVEATPGTLRDAIRPAGTYRQKEACVRNVCRRIVEDFDGRLDALFDGPTDDVRRRLLDLPGVGPETADAILVYAAGRPRFVVDAYTRRIARRLGLVEEDDYDRLQRRFESALPADASYLARAHAAFVEHAKARCTKRAPACDGCPVEDACRKVDVVASAQA